MARYPGRRRRRAPEPPPPSPPQSRANQLLDEATILRSSWGAPNALLEPEKAIEYNERLIRLYEETRAAAVEEGSSRITDIANGWLERIRETNEAIRRRVLESTAQQPLPGVQENPPSEQSWWVSVFFHEDPDLQNQIEQTARRHTGEPIFRTTFPGSDRQEISFRFPTPLSMANFHRDVQGLPGVTSVEMIPPRRPAPNPVEGNLAETDEIQPGVGGTPRVAEAEICDSRTCEVAHLLVRGDYIEFVSVEQVRRVGSHPLDERAMPSDIVLPRGYVLVHDATGTVLTPCDLYAVKWHRSSAKSVQEIAQEDLAAAQDYFGNDAKIRAGQVDLPDGHWSKFARVKFIRYRRYGFSNHFEHEYTPAVDLYFTKRPLAWKLALPEGCVVDSRGFVVP